MPIRSNARKAYKELAKYYGLRTQDAYLSAITGQKKSTGSAEKKSDLIEKVLRNFMDDSTPNQPMLKTGGVFGDLAPMDSNSAEVKKLKDLICITPFDDELGGTSADKLPLNFFSGKYKEQGWGKPKGEYYKFTDISKGKRPAVPIHLVQVFPVNSSVAVSDTDLISLLMNSIPTLEMTRAVPYIDIEILDASHLEGASNSPLSLARFLSTTKKGGSSDFDKAIFIDKFGKASEGKNVELKDENGSVKAVATMEIFTTPQTLVAAGDVRYDERVGGAIDKFRPFLALENLGFSVVPSKGLHSFKSADMTVRLLDRGRMSEVAPLVSPGEFGKLQLKITWGWSHPSAGSVSRPSSSVQLENAFGALLGSMQVTELYNVINSDFNFSDDGSVTINLKLAMAGNTEVNRLQWQDADSTASMKELQDLLSQVESMLKQVASSNKSSLKRLGVPTVLHGATAGSVLSYEKKTVDEIRKFIKANRNSNLTGMKALGKALTDIFKKPKKGEETGLAKVQKNRAQEIAGYIDMLEKTPDPFLPGNVIIKGSFGPENAYGANKKYAPPTHFKARGNEANKRKKQRYVSFGKLMMTSIGRMLTGDSGFDEIQIVTNCFNDSAGGAYNLNIAQFPIFLDTFEELLKIQFKKKASFTFGDLLEIINSSFVSQHGNLVYGLSNIYSQSRIKKGGAYKKKPGVTAKNFNNKLAVNLKDAYGGADRELKFVPPQLRMRIDAKMHEGQRIGKAVFYDAAATPASKMNDVFRELASNPFVIKDTVETSSEFRSPGHGAVINAVYDELIKIGALHSLDPELRAKVDEGLAVPISNRILQFDPAKKQTKIKDVIFEMFPTLMYGIGTSGIIQASLSSQNNERLSTIALLRQLKGGSGQLNESNFTLPLQVHPTQLRLTTIGCPLWKVGQIFFVDFGTNTTADNFYGVNGVDFSIGPGTFESSVRLVQIDGFGAFRNPADNAARIKALQALAQKELKKAKG